MDPKVSVVTTLFNYAHYIGESINAFLLQDFPESEMVIVDDGSTDNWKEKITPFIKRHPDRIRLFSLGSNHGYSAAKNCGIALAKSSIIVMLDADDMLMSNGISTRYAVMTKKDHDMVHAPALKLGKNNSITPDFYPATQRAKAYRKPDGYRLIHAQGVMIKKSAHDIVGMYDESMRCSSDKEMWARCLKRLKIGFSFHPCALYRIHASQMHKSPWKMSKLDKLTKELNKKIKRRSSSLEDVIMLKDYNIPNCLYEVKP